MENLKRHKSKYSTIFLFSFVLFTIIALSCTSIFVPPTEYYYNTNEPNGNYVEAHFCAVGMEDMPGIWLESNCYDSQAIQDPEIVSFV